MSIKRRDTVSAEQANYIETESMPKTSVIDAYRISHEHIRHGGVALVMADRMPHPRDLPLDDLKAFLSVPNQPGCPIEKRYRERVKSPLTAIRAFCVLCSGGSPKEASHCQKVTCALWPFRRGNNSMRRRA